MVPRCARIVKFDFRRVVQYSGRSNIPDIPLQHFWALQMLGRPLISLILFLFLYLRWLSFWIPGTWIRPHRRLLLHLAWWLSLLCYSFLSFLFSWCQSLIRSLKTLLSLRRRFWLACFDIYVKAILYRLQNRSVRGVELHCGAVCSTGSHDGPYRMPPQVYKIHVWRCIPTLSLRQGYWKRCLREIEGWCLSSCCCLINHPFGQFEYLASLPSFRRLFAITYMLNISVNSLTWPIHCSCVMVRRLHRGFSCAVLSAAST